jgi:hypothetical protein
VNKGQQGQRMSNRDGQKNPKELEDEEVTDPGASPSAEEASADPAPAPQPGQDTGSGGGQDTGGGGSTPA